MATVEIRSNVQPPKKVASVILDAIGLALQDRDDPVQAIQPLAGEFPVLTSLVELLASPKSLGPTPIRPGRTAAYPTSPAQKVEATRLASGSAVEVMLAAADFWAATRVSGGTWEAAIGLPDLFVELEFPLGSGRATWRHRVPAVDTATYVREASAVTQKLTSDASFALRRDAAWQMPELMMAVSLGLIGQGTAKPYTCMLFDIVPAVATVAVQRLKHIARAPRPSELVGVTPTRPAPKFTSYPGGHSTVMHAMATVVADVTGADSAALDALADLLAVDRERAGLHSTIDTERGQALGQQLGRWMIDAASHTAAFGAWSAVYSLAAEEWNP